MGRRLRGVAIVVVLLGVGALAGSAVSQWRSPFRADAAGEPADAAGRPRAPVGRVRVEILNGGGRADMARRATDHLRERGFDVVYYGNADTFEHDSTVVLDRVARPELASAVARALGASPLRVGSEPDSTRFVDVTVVLGSSWSPPAGGGVSMEPVGRPAWWDPRRFLPERGVATPGGRGRMTDPGKGGS